MKHTLRFSLLCAFLFIAASSFGQKINFAGKILFSHDRMEPNYEILYYVDGASTPTKSDKDRTDYMEEDKFWSEVYISPASKTLKIEIKAAGYETQVINIANVRFNEVGVLKVAYTANNFIKLKPLNLPRIADIKYRNTIDYSTHIMFISIYNPLKDTVRLSDIRMEAKGIYESGITCLVPVPDAQLYTISDKINAAQIKDVSVYKNNDEDSAKFATVGNETDAAEGDITVNICDHFRDINFHITVASGITVAPNGYTTVKIKVPEFLNMERIDRKDTRQLKINTGISSFDKYYFTVSGKTPEAGSMEGNFKPPYDKEGMKGYFLNRESLLVDPENKVK